MNLLIVARDFKPNAGGIAEYTHQLADHLQRAGDAVMVLSPRIDPAEDAAFDARCAYRVRRFDYPATTVSRFRRNRILYAAIENAIKDHAADLIVNNTSGNFVFLCWLISRATGVPYCALAHGRDISRRIPLTWRMKQWVALRGAARVFCNSSYTAAMARTRGARADRIGILNPGCHLDGLETLAPERCATARRQLGLEGRKVVLTVGRLIELKGNDKIIEALPTVRQEVPDVLYVIVGEGPHLPVLQRQVKDLGLEDHVRFDGYVEVLDRTKPSYYDAADVFAMPSRQGPDGNCEGFGMVFLEASAHGKPVIGGRSGGIVDAIDHERSGFLVDPLNVAEIGATIVRLLKDEELCRRMGEWGRRRVLTEFCWEAVASRMREGLAGIAGRETRGEEPA